MAPKRGRNSTAAAGAEKRRKADGLGTSVPKPTAPRPAGLESGEIRDDVDSMMGGDMMDTAVDIIDTRIPIRHLDYDLTLFPEDLTYDDASMPRIESARSPVSHLVSAAEDEAGRNAPMGKFGQVSSSVKSKLKSVATTVSSILVTKEPDKNFLIDAFKHIEKLDGGWIGCNKTLGKGGQGCTRLFVKLDANGKIIDRIAVKESFNTYGSWSSLDFWHTDRPFKDPREVIVHKTCSLDTHDRWERYIVKYLSHSVDHEHLTHRTYMEFADGGDLQSLFEAQKEDYWHVNETRESIDDPEGTDVPGEGVPEPFVWYFLKQMAIALHRLENIPLRKYKGQTVVHQDIKPNNIFMSSPNPVEFPRYPVCKIGDFGSARITSEADRRNPLSYSDAVTYGFVAPEMSNYVKYRTEHDWKLSTATNIWQIGTTALELMTLDRAEPISYESIDVKDYKPILKSLLLIYSQELTDLLGTMLRGDPTRRPSPRTILRKYHKNRKLWEAMEKAPECDDFENYVSWLHWQPSGKWRAGDKFENVEFSELRKSGLES